MPDDIAAEFAADLREIGEITPQEEPKKEVTPDVKPKDEPKGEPVTELKEEPKPKTDAADSPEFPDVADNPPDADNPKSVKSWQEHKKLLKEAHAEIAALKAKKPEAQEAPEIDNTEVETLKDTLAEKDAELAELKKELKLANYERSDEYKKEVAIPLKNLKDEIFAIAENAEVDGRRLWDAMHEGDVKSRVKLVQDIISGMSDFDRSTVVDATKRIHQIESRKAEIAGDADRALNEAQTKRAQQELELRETDKRQHKVLAQKTWESLKDKGFLNEIEGAESWNAALRKARAVIENPSIETMETPERAAMLAKSAAYPFVEAAAKHYKARLTSETEKLTTKLTELENELKRYRGTQPKTGSGDDADDSSKDDDLDKPLGETIFR
jgi:hypothetical protein